MSTPYSTRNLHAPGYRPPKTRRKELATAFSRAASRIALRETALDAAARLAFALSQCQDERERREIRRVFDEAAKGYG